MATRLTDLQVVPPADRNPCGDKPVIADQFQERIAGAHDGAAVGQDGRNGTGDRRMHPAAVERVEKIRQRPIGL